MKILSDKTNKEYATVEECLAAEKAFDEMVAKQQAEKEKALAEQKAKEEKLAAERKARATEVEDAYIAVLGADRHYQELLSAFVKDYGSFHMTLHTGNLNPFNSFTHFFDNFF